LKPRLLSLLACPECTSDLRLDAQTKDGPEIVEGSLACTKCNTRFPIRNGIPRFVPHDAYVDTFSFEWNRFRDVQIDIRNATDESERSFRLITGWAPGDLSGKTVLDVGVGAGRYAEVASRWGAEVVGVDLSFAVDAAYDTIGRRENVHIVQADLFRPPFRRETFDAVYSMGVLHHTPDTRKAFEAVTPLLKRGGDFAVFLYAHGHYCFFSDLWRKLTTRLPYRVIYWLAWLSIPVYPLYRIPGIGLCFRFLFPMSRHPKGRWRWLDTFDWYTPMYQHKHTWPEVHEWFLSGGFEDIRLSQADPDASLLNIYMRGRKRQGAGVE